MADRGKGIGESRRQDAIDFILKNAGALAADIVAALNWKVDSGGKRLQRMCETKELRRESTIVEYIDPSGHRKAVRTFKYWALTEIALTHAEVTAVLGTKRKEAEAEEMPRPGVTTNNKPNRPALKNQGGQGAVRGPFRSSSIDWLD